MNARPLLLVFVLLQLCVAFFTDSQTFTHEESMWHYIGRNWLRLGLTPYEGGVDNKSPLIFAVFGLSDLLFGLNYWFPRLLGIAVQTAGLYYLYRIALRITNSKPQLPGTAANTFSRQAAMIALTLYGLSLLWRTTGGKYVSFTETYAVSFILAAVYYYLKGGNKNYFISGLLAGIACGWRLSASFGMLALFIHSLLKRRAGIVPFIVGAVTGIAMLILIALAAGIDLRDIYVYAFADNFGGGSTTDHALAWRLENFIDNFFDSELILFYIPLAGYFFLKKQYSLLTIWLICEFVGINLLGIYARPHFKQLLPVLSLMSGISIAYLINNYGVPFRQVMIVLWIVFFPKVTEPITGLKKILLGSRDRSAEYCQIPFPRPDEQAEKKLGQWIKANTKPNELVLVAGFGARVQLYSERLSPTIYFNVTQTDRAMAQFSRDLYRTRPHMIAVPLFPDYNKHVTESIREPIKILLAKEYEFEQCLYGYGVYRHKESGVSQMGE